jgi:hypothetical protein
MTKEQLMELVDLHAAQLAEHFDSVRIFCTKHNSDGEGDSATQGYSKGRGNYYAQEGQIREWLTAMNEETRVNQRLNQLDDGDEYL